MSEASSGRGLRRSNLVVVNDSGGRITSGTARKVGPCLWIQAIDFNQSNAILPVRAADDRGVGTRDQRRQDRRLAVIRRIKAAEFELGFLRLLPIIIRGDDCARLVVNAQGRIGEWSGYVRRGEARAEGANNKVCRLSAQDDETT